jgi:hypothetical protein
MKITQFIFFAFFLAAINTVQSQTFQSTSNGTWSSSNIWTVTNVCDKSYTSPPPTQGYDPKCAIDVIISHAVTYSGSSQFGAGYFRSITVKNGGSLKFDGDFVLSTGGSEYQLKITVEDGGKIEVPNGSFKFQRNALVEIQNGGILAVKNLEGGGGNGGTLHIKAGASFTSSNLVNLNNGLRLNIEGTFNANKLIAQGGGNAIQILGESKFTTTGDVEVNGFPFTASGNSRVTIGGNLSVTNSGQSKFNLNGKSHLKVMGKTTIGNLLQVSEDASTLFSNNVNITTSGQALLEVINNGDVQIIGNLIKDQWSGAISVQNSGQLIIIGDGTNSPIFPPTSYAQMNIAPSPAYYGIGTIMPVEFSSFTAEAEKWSSSTLLAWTTAKEWQNSHFEIERSIDNITNWQTIGEVAGSGFADAATDYTFDDKKLPANGGRIFYRIKQVNFDQKISYSAIQAITVEGASAPMKWTAYPNPTNGQDIKLELTRSSLAEDSSFYVILSSVHGQQGFLSGSSVDEINLSLRKELTQKKPGIYLLKVMWKDNSQTLTIVKN